MIKRTLYFGNPAILSLKNNQLILKFPEVERYPEVKRLVKEPTEFSYHIPDLGILILDHPQITITHALISELIKNNVVIISCNESHHPRGLMLTLHSNTLQSERYQSQISASEPLKKQLWMQIVKQKIINQAKVLKNNNPKANHEFLLKLVKDVKSGDSTNREAVAASFYWSNLFVNEPFFVRSREGDPPNNLLNYVYSIIRACVARSIVEAGLLPTLGIHHHSRYNPYCLADDLMEPYRPYGDDIVYKITSSKKDYSELNKEIKQELLRVLYIDCKISGEVSPLQIACLRTARSLFQCFEGKLRKLQLPELD
ncbi:MAG: type II CRISPR-associated endonuclease Cas1 [Bacteroidales bacterium]